MLPGWRQADSHSLQHWTNVALRDYLVVHEYLVTSYSQVQCRPVARQAHVLELNSLF